MRGLTDAARLREFMRRVGMNCRCEARIYLADGATAVLHGWRPATMDVDLKIEGAEEEVLKALPALKEELDINVELAAPDQSIPPLPAWKERCVPVAREGAIAFLHYDYYAQALAKINRGHELDLADVREMLRRGLVDPQKARAFFARIEPLLYRYPSIRPAAFRSRMEASLPETPSHGACG